MDSFARNIPLDKSDHSCPEAVTGLCRYRHSTPLPVNRWKGQRTRYLLCRACELLLVRQVSLTTLPRQVSLTTFCRVKGDHSRPEAVTGLSRFCHKLKVEPSRSQETQKLKVLIDLAFYCSRTFGDGPRHFEPWSSDEAGTPSPNFHTTPHQLDDV
ncbi:hypothetical protein TNCV_5058641 [Trichonephila clavipes]|nr:hypothetical protein TNCV_5058641 [Trichonephila clavipes]